MTRALLKKQLMEFAFLFVKKGKDGNKKGKLSGAITLLAVLTVLMMAAFGAMAAGVHAMLSPLGLQNLYLSVMGITGLVLGLIGSVFTTYSVVFAAKDNELLLSMPIPPTTVILTRILTVYISSTGYIAMAWIPGILVYWILNPVTAGTVLMDILLLPVMGLLITVLAAILGWVVAWIAARVKSKSLTVVLASVLGLGAYYFLYFKAQVYIRELGEIGEEAWTGLKQWGYPLYAIGAGGTGEAIPFLVLTAASVAAAAITVWILQATFLRIVTKNTGAAGTAYKAKKTKLRTPRQALFSKEWKHFLKSPVYLLNGGLGGLIVLIIAVLGIVKRADLAVPLQLLQAELPQLGSFIAGVIAAILLLAISMDGITAPSVSLEGKNLWILRTSPASFSDIAAAKVGLQLSYNIPPTVLAAVMLSIAYAVPFADVILLVLLIGAFEWLHAYIGLYLNLKRVTLEWSSENVPVKQSLPVLFDMLISFAVVLAFGAGYYFAVPYLTAHGYMALFTTLLAAVTLYIRKRTMTDGKEAFERL